MTEEEINKLAAAIGRSSAFYQKEILTLDEVAQYTGLTKSYLYKLTSGSMIPHSKPNGKNCFFRRSDVEEWLMNNPVATNTDLNSQALTYCMKK